MKNNILLILSALTCLAAPPPEHIPARSARNFIGHERMVCGEITQVVNLGYGSFINMGNNWQPATRETRPYLIPDFTAVLWERHRTRLGISPAREFHGKVMCITGLITSYNLTPQIEIKSIDQYTLDGVEND